MTLSNEQQPSANPAETFQISLLEEKLQVARHRKKIGEVVIRKQIETRMAQVPIRREKLIVERIGENPELLTEVIIGESKVNIDGQNGFNPSSNINLSQSNFLPLSTAQQLLEAISHLSSIGNAKIRLEIITDNTAEQDEMQHTCDRYIN